MKLKQVKLILWLGGSLLFSLSALANLERNFARAGGSPHAFKLAQCFLENYHATTFRAKPPQDRNFDRRCLDHGDFQLGQTERFVIIDYTKPSDQKRLFILNRRTGQVETMAVAHGRYEAGVLNSRLGPYRNSVKQIQYYSNEIDSNASSSGFFIAGQDYDGNYGRAAVLFGLEEGINDNACERAIVIHPHLMVSKNKARIMSSGCPMVSRSQIDTLLDQIAGRSIAEDDIGMAQTGGLVLIYSEREASLSSCHEANFER